MYQFYLQSTVCLISFYFSPWNCPLQSKLPPSLTCINWNCSPRHLHSSLPSILYTAGRVTLNYKFNHVSLWKIFPWLPTTKLLDSALTLPLHHLPPPGSPATILYTQVILPFTLLNTMHLPCVLPASRPSMCCSLCQEHASYLFNLPLFMFQVQDTFLLEAFPDRLPSPHLSPRRGCVLLLWVPTVPCRPSHSDCLTQSACSNRFPMDQEVCVGRPCLLFSALFHQHFAQCLAHSRYLTSAYIPSALLYAFQGKRIFLLLLFSQ